MKDVFTSPALNELKIAAQYYEDQVAGLGEEFLDEVESSIQRILMFPEAWGRIEKNYFHCHLRRFPYSLIYTIKPKEVILFVAVFHQKREPKSWRNNL